MILHDVKSNGNRYCGPAAISAIAGIGTDEAARMIREHTGKRKVIGTFAEDILPIIEKLGFAWRKVEVLQDETLGQWCNTFPRDPERVYLISAGKHWQCVWQDRYVCGKTILSVGLLNPFVPRKAKVIAVYEIREAVTQ